jgi:glycosyltransferase involved in cell wall biosynthesis
MIEGLVSICIPTHNGSDYLEEALLSAFAQDYSSIEIVVSDDGSTDDTLRIVREAGNTHQRSISVHHHPPAGIGSNWNNCVDQANGEFIKFLFQDDLLDPGCVSRMVALAQMDPGVGLVYCRRRIIHDPEDSRHVAWVRRFAEVHTSWQNLVVREGVASGRDYLADPSIWEEPRNRIGEPTAVLLRRSVFDTEGLFDEKLRQELDFVQWYKIMRHWRVGFIDAELVSFRLHPSQATWTNRRNGAVLGTRALAALYLRLFFRYLHPSVRRRLLRMALLYPAARLRRAVSVRRAQRP